MNYIKAALLLIALALTAAAVPAEAQVCVKCIARNCQSGLTSGYVNCASDGEKCIQWDECSSSMAVPGEPVASVALSTPEKRWAFASVQVVPARPNERLRWQLARVEVTPRK